MTKSLQHDLLGTMNIEACVIPQLFPRRLEDVEVHFVIATCENMVSGNPGTDSGAER